MVNSFKKWLLKNFEHNELVDIANYGAQNGFHGLIYYSETTKLYRQYKENIWDMLYEDADSQGLTVTELIDSFNGSKNVNNEDQFENLLVWYAAEKVAWEVTECEYQN